MGLYVSNRFGLVQSPTALFEKNIEFSETPLWKGFFGGIPLGIPKRHVASLKKNIDSFLLGQHDVTLGDPKVMVGHIIYVYTVTVMEEIRH